MVTVISCCRETPECAVSTSAKVVQHHGVILSMPLLPVGIHHLTCSSASLVSIHFMTSLAHHQAVQVVVKPLLQVQATDAAAGVNVPHCTQIPRSNASTGLKRMRKERQYLELADGVEATPTPQRRLSTRKVMNAECGLADMTLQTPMPESDAPNVLGPPPPDSTPAPKRGNSCANRAHLLYIGNCCCAVAWYLVVIYHFKDVNCGECSSFFICAI